MLITVRLGSLTEVPDPFEMSGLVKITALGLTSRECQKQTYAAA
jgi:hypothetical protein